MCPGGLRCGVIESGLRWAARTSAESGQLHADQDLGYEWLATHDEDWQRALDVQAALGRGGQARVAGFPGLLIAAVGRARARHRVALRRRLRPHRGSHRPAHAMGHPCGKDGGGPGAWICIEDESGQGLRPPKGR